MVQYRSCPCQLVITRCTYDFCRHAGSYRHACACSCVARPEAYRRRRTTGMPPCIIGMHKRLIRQNGITRDDRRSYANSIHSAGDRGSTFSSRHCVGSGSDSSSNGNARGQRTRPKRRLPPGRSACFAHDAGDGVLPGMRQARVGTLRWASRRNAGVIAVDPHAIPLGTLLYVPGYGYGRAADIGRLVQRPSHRYLPAQSPGSATLGPAERTRIGIPEVIMGYLLGQVRQVGLYFERRSA